MSKAKGPIQRTGLHILVVDDDELFRGALTRTLRAENFEVTPVADGKAALGLALIDRVDLVIADISMPGMNGLELLRTLRDSQPDLPIILITGIDDLKETVDVHTLGAKGFLSKPFDKEDLLAVVSQFTAPKGADTAGKKQKDNDLDLEFCKLSIEDFISGKQIRFDIFIRLSATNYVKIANEGEALPLERVHAYRSKNIHHLYMRRDDFKKYMGFNLALAPLVVAKETIPKTKKFAFLKHTSEVILEQLFLEGVDEPSFQAAKTIVEATTTLLSEPDEFMTLLTILNSHADHLYAHGIGVSIYSVMIARQLHWHTPANIHKVAMGGILHDLGQKEIEREILAKPRKDFTVEEIKLYESHPLRGAEILGQLPSVPSDVLQILMQHHENCLGLGYPAGLSKSRIHPMARVVAVADAFCELVLKGPNSPNLKPPDAFQRMLLMHSQNLDPTCFLALMKVFAFQPPHDFGRKAPHA